VTVHFEQAVYGSFPFWNKGYAVLAQSSGCRTEWLHELRTACQRYGEPPRGIADTASLFALHLPSGPWAIVGVSAPGHDDQGRPGALAFHALFLSRKEFRKARFNPFALAAALRREWGPETRALDPSSCIIKPEEGELPESEDPWVRRTIATLMEGGRLAIESEEPIDAIAREAWSRLPDRVRRRASLATFAFSAANRFDLVGSPHLTGVGLDPSYAKEGTNLTAGRRTFSIRLPSARLARTAAVAAVLALGCGAFWGIVRRYPVVALDARGTIGVPPQAGPDRAHYLNERLGPDDRERVTEGLIDLAERLGISEPSERGLDSDLTKLMVRLSDSLHYHGPDLSAAELSRLAGEQGSDRDRALSWHAQIQRFRADRPLPPDFVAGPLRWQLDTLAWSFHVEPDRRRSVPELPHELAQALTAAGPMNPNPLATRYPALDAYNEFLNRLPRR
jgi:hypothetical protein